MDVLPELGRVAIEQAKRFRSISLSGCTADFTMAGLADRFDNRHLWRITFPALMSRPHEAEIALPEHPRAERFLGREMRKGARAVLREADCDLVVIDFAGDHLVNFLRFEGCVVPDLRNGIFEPHWAEIDFSVHPLLAEAEVLCGHDDAYWALWRESFAAFYAESLAPRIAGGAKVAILTRRLCRSYLAEGAEHRFDLSPALEEADARLPVLYDWLAGFPGLHFIPFDPALLISAAEVPYGGPWPFHPVKEAFASVQAALLQLMGEDEAARAVEPGAMVGLLREGAARAHERDVASAAMRQAEAERDVASAALRQAEAERDVASAAARQAEAERDVALGRIGDLEQALRLTEAARGAHAAEAALLRRVLGQGTGRRARLLRWSGLVELARHAARRRRWMRAERLYRLVLRACPGQPALWVQLGHMLKEQGAVVAAAGAYRMAEQLAPGESDAARHLAALGGVTG